MADEIQLIDIFLRGLRADQPAASTLCPGIQYYVTDEAVTEQVDAGGNWVSVTDGNTLPVYNNGNISGNIQIDWSNGNVQEITLTGNITLLAPVNPINGPLLTIVFIQDGTGGWSATFPASMKLSGGVYTLTSTPDQADSLTLIYNGTIYREISRANAIQ